MRKVCFKLTVIILLIFAEANGQQYSDESLPSEEFNAIVDALMEPENFKYEMHRKSLENALENLLAEYYDQSLEEDDKRSIATLAKNGQLPSREPDTEMDTLTEDENGHKRNLASMARSGMIGGKRNIQSLARQMQYGSGKRNIGSLMRSNMLPGSGKRAIASIMKAGYGKRAIASIMKAGYGKRNVGTLARDWALPKFVGAKYGDDEKRNIQSLKNQFKGGRKKRDIGETLEPVFQNDPINYEEFLQNFNSEIPEVPEMSEEKRFLASSDLNQPKLLSTGYQKRHIGAMARSGWIPSFRPFLNRFSRSGRTAERVAEYFSPQDRRRLAHLPGISCKRCELDQGLRRSENSLRNFGLASSVQTRSGFRSTPPRVTALNWKERW